MKHSAQFWLTPDQATYIGDPAVYFAWSHSLSRPVVIDNIDLAHYRNGQTFFRRNDWAIVVHFGR